MFLWLSKVISAWHDNVFLWNLFDLHHWEDGVVETCFHHLLLFSNDILTILDQIEIALFMLWLNVDPNVVIFDQFFASFRSGSIACPRKDSLDPLVVLIKLDLVHTSVFEIHLAPEALLRNVQIHQFSIGVVSVEIDRLLVVCSMHSNVYWFAFVIEDTLNNVSVW